MKTKIIKVKCISNRVGILPSETGEFSSSNLAGSNISLIEVKVYELLTEKNDFYQIVDESGESYWHPGQAFIKL